MQRKAIRKVSDKRREQLKLEKIQATKLLEKCHGVCMVCGKAPDFRGLYKEHHYGGKKREMGDFILVCGKCASLQHGIEEA